MPKAQGLKRVMVIGSGPIVIGQAAEFDYAGTQACKALREEGMEVILVNSNPATIMTDPEVADAVYLEPLDIEFLTRIVEKERPDGLLPTLGGQTGLNMAVLLSENGVLEKYNVKLLGTSLDTIRKAEDREMFKKTMEDIHEPVPESIIASTLSESLGFAREIGYPVIVRPAYTLGGAGGGIAEDEETLKEIVSRGLKSSPISQVLLERSVAGWKEIEYEVMRDSQDNCITVCNMENIDPIGIHTGDSVVVAPTQTLADKEHQMLRTAALRIIRALGVEGGCNIQFALSTEGPEYYVIEVNPRVSRSSALASKATGYPIAKVAAKIGIGLTLDEIPNAITEKTVACFEPALDYCVIKFPRWPFDKFITANRVLGTQMKATGEVMSIDRTFEGALQKAVRSLEIGLFEFYLPDLKEWSDEKVKQRLSVTDDERLFVVAEALRRGVSPDYVHNVTTIDPWFISKILNIITLEKKLQNHIQNTPWNEWAKSESLLMRKAKEWGFSDQALARILSVPEGQLRNWRKKWNVIPNYKMVDTCAAEFEASTPYYYSTYGEDDEVGITEKKKVLVIGSGPIRIGQGVEFDYCSVHAVWALQKAGYEAIIINNNPETVSTDFDTSDKLYFEPLALEDVLNVIDKEKPEGVVVQFGGQTAINLASHLSEQGVKILGTSVDCIDLAEDRERFDSFLRRMGIPQTEGRAATSMEEAMGFALKIGFPLMVRPSYVLGGRAMEIVHTEEELFEYMKTAVKVTPDHPVLVDRYISGMEIEVDAVSDGETVIIPGIMEHIERAGVHSGDSYAIFPQQRLTKNQLDRIVDYTKRMAIGLGIKGLMNIQYVVAEDKVVVLEVNPRASRTVPFLSKVTGVPMVYLATQTMFDKKLKDMGYEDGLMPSPPYVSVKAPVFSFEKMGAVDVSLGPEMKSTGEVLGLDSTLDGAVYKALVAAGSHIPDEGNILVTLADKDKKEGKELLKNFAGLGYKFYATHGTAKLLEEMDIPSVKLLKIGEGHPNVLDVIKEGEVNFVLNTPTRGKIPQRNGFQMRRAAVEFRIPCLTSMDTARALLRVVQARKKGYPLDLLHLNEYLTKAGRKSGLQVLNVE